MPIVNKGVLNTKDVYLRRVGNDWPTAQVITTSDVIESESNLYFTNTRVVSALISGDNIVIEANGRISSTASGSGSLTGIDLSANTTTDLAEGANLYFTNARVVSALIAGDNITIEANGRISSTSASIVANDNTTFVTTAGNLTYSMSRNVTDSKNILVIIEGLIQLPEVDYTVSGSNISFTSQPPVGTNVEIRFFGDESISVSTTSTLPLITRTTSVSLTVTSGTLTVEGRAGNTAITIN